MFAASDGNQLVTIVWGDTDDSVRDHCMGEGLGDTDDSVSHHCMGEGLGDTDDSVRDWVTLMTQ